MAKWVHLPKKASLTQQHLSKRSTYSQLIPLKIRSNTRLRLMISLTNNSPARRAIGYASCRLASPNLNNKGLISIDRNNKATLLLTIPRRILKSSTMDFTEEYLYNPGQANNFLVYPTPLPVQRYLFISNHPLNSSLLAWVLT